MATTAFWQMKWFMLNFSKSCQEGKLCFRSVCDSFSNKTCKKSIQLLRKKKKKKRPEFMWFLLHRWMEITITAFLKCGNEKRFGRAASFRWDFFQTHHHCLVANRKDPRRVFPVPLGLHLSGCHCQASVPVFFQKRRVWLQLQRWRSVRTTKQAVRLVSASSL